MLKQKGTLVEVGRAYYTEHMSASGSKMQNSTYQPRDIESKWQAKWQETNIFATPSRYRTDGTVDSRPKYYILEMFPYPSGRLHMGHMRNYTLGDVLARAHRMAGYRVLYPLGWDAFGLPAENAALQAQVHPREWTVKNIETMKKSLTRMGLSYDWSREFMTCDPSYYVHEQRIFIEMWKRGLAYRKAAVVNFCPTCATVLANEQVEDGRCWRCQSVVEQKELEQWFLRITTYAEELLADLSSLEGKWPDKVLNMQRQWMGRSEGAIFRFCLEQPQSNVSTMEIFTTRPDTLFGVTFLALAPEHPLALTLSKGTSQESAVGAFVNQYQRQDRTTRNADELAKEGVFTGAYALHPATQERIPIYVANFVLMEYGAGALMGVPAHDTRDFVFARAHQIPIRAVIRPTDPLAIALPLQEAYTGPGTLQASGDFTGQASDEAGAAIRAWAEKNGWGHSSVQYKLRDWLLSRQRYWGCPIPMVRCLKGGHGYQPVPDTQLPVLLPEEVDFQPGGASPLKRHPTWRHTTCPVCQGPAERETDTMDGFMESSWYFLRYPSATYANGIIDAEGASFLPVDQYIGGAEHATKHLIYARFFTKMLRDWGVLPSSITEPFASLLTQGMVLKDAHRCPTHGYLYPEQVTTNNHCQECGQHVEIIEHTKMSKSFRNVVEPLPLMEKYGADTARLFGLFAAPPDTVMEWNDAAIEGVHRFLQRVYRLVARTFELPKAEPKSPSEEQARLRLMHQTIRRVTHDVFVRKQFNTAIAALMEWTNVLTEQSQTLLENTPAWTASVETLLKLLNPMAPHLCEELWQALGNQTLLVYTPWPVHDDQLAAEDTWLVVIQVNGKKRAEIKVPAQASEKEVQAQALQTANVVEHTKGRSIKKMVYVPGRLLNIVVGAYP